MERANIEIETNKLVTQLPFVWLQLERFAHVYAHSCDEQWKSDSLVVNNNNAQYEHERSLTKHRHGHWLDGLYVVHVASDFAMLWKKERMKKNQQLSRICNGVMVLYFYSPFETKCTPFHSIPFQIIASIYSTKQSRSQRGENRASFRFTL